MSERIDCGIERGEGDARMRLVIDGGDAAIQTNRGPMPIDITGEGVRDRVSPAAACAALGATWEEIRAAVEVALPEAAGWDWCEVTDPHHALRHWVGDAEQCEAITQFGRDYPWDLSWDRDVDTVSATWYESATELAEDAVREIIDDVAFAREEGDDSEVPEDAVGRLRAAMVASAVTALRAAMIKGAQRPDDATPPTLDEAIARRDEVHRAWLECACPYCEGDLDPSCPLSELDDAASADLDRAREHAVENDLPRTWFLSEEGHGYGEFVGTREEAIDEVQSNVERINYPDTTGTIWIDVMIRCEATDEEWSGSVTLDEPEPDCHPGYTHEWIAPHWLVGGIKENPGVWGNGGGVVIHEACRHCGCERVTDTWAQRPDTGEQGLTSVEYREGEYAEALRERGEEEARAAVLERDDDAACEGHGRLWCEGYRETMAERRDEAEDAEDEDEDEDEDEAENAEEDES
jgi:hypothetical protein